MTGISIGINIFTRTYWFSGNLQILKLITEMIYLIEIIKPTERYKQLPVFNGYLIVPELNDVLQSSYYESPLGYEIVIWFLDEALKVKK